LPRLWAVYNDSLAEYRRNHRLRSASHPVPNLAADDGWLEAPFWVWRRDDPRRRALFALQSGGELRLSDRAGFELRLPLAADAEADAAAEILHSLPAQGVKLRTRALTTTLWARLALGDLFIHGLGGAKYDQLCDALIERFFGLEPPAFLAISATLYLPVERPAVSEDERRQLEQRLRALWFGPERFIEIDQVPAADRPRVLELLASKQESIARPAEGPIARQRFLEIRRSSEALRPWVADEVLRVTRQRQEVQQRQQAARILGSREYLFCFYSWKKMETLLLEFPPAPA
jgi:hypothetical protein